MFVHRLRHTELLPFPGNDSRDHGASVSAAFKGKS